MKVETLEAYDVPADILEIWRSQVGGELLPVQERAESEVKLRFAGRSPKSGPLACFPEMNVLSHDPAIPDEPHAGELEVNTAIAQCRHQRILDQIG